jgi:hypothetical protein
MQEKKPDPYIRMLGMPAEDLRRQIARRLDEGEDLTMMIASILSDAQELIQGRDQTRALQAINRAKWILFEHREETQL